MVNPELDKVWLIRLPVPGAKPDKLGEVGEQVQEKEEPVTVEVRVMVMLFEVQMACARGDVVTWGVGLTVTTTG